MIFARRMHHAIVQKRRNDLPELFSSHQDTASTFGFMQGHLDTMTVDFISDTLGLRFFHFDLDRIFPDFFLYMGAGNATHVSQSRTIKTLDISLLLFFDVLERVFEMLKRKHI